MTPSELAKLQLENVTTWMAFSQAGGGVAPFTAEGSMPACATDPSLRGEV